MRKHIQNISKLVLVASMTLLSTSLLANNASQTEQKLVNTAAMDLANKTALKLLVYQAVVSKKIGDVAAVDEDVQELYGKIRGYYLGSVPATIVGGGAVYASQSSLEEFESVIRPLTASARKIGELVGASAETSWKSMELIYVDVLLEQIGRSIEFSFKNFVYPITQALGSLVNEAILTSSGASTLSGVAVASGFFMLNPTANKAMTYEMVNEFLGQNVKIKQKLDDLVDNLSLLIELSPSDKETIKAEVFIQVLEQATANNFSSKASDYDVDVVQIMQDNNIISTETREVFNGLQFMFAKVSKSASQVTIADQAELENRVNEIAALSAVLSTTLASQKIDDPKIEEELELLLGKIEVKMKLIKFMQN